MFMISHPHLPGRLSYLRALLSHSFIKQSWDIQLHSPQPAWVMVRLWHHLFNSYVFTKHIHYFAFILLYPSTCAGFSSLAVLICSLLEVFLVCLWNSGMCCIYWWSCMNENVDVFLRQSWSAFFMIVTHYEQFLLAVIANYCCYC